MVIEETHKTIKTQNFAVMKFEKIINSCQFFTGDPVGNVKCQCPIRVKHSYQLKEEVSEYSFPTMNMTQKSL